MSLKVNDLYLEYMRDAYNDAMDTSNTSDLVSIVHELQYRGFGKEAVAIERDYKMYNK